MKVCVYNVTSTIAPIGSREIGGVEIYTFRVAEALATRGHDVVLYGGKPATHFPLPSPQITKTFFPFTDTEEVVDLGTRFQRLVQRVDFTHASRCDLLSESFDAVLVFKPYDFISAWLWKKWGLRSRIIASLHGCEFYPLDQHFSRSIDRMYSVSDETSLALSNRYSRDCQMIPNFVLENCFTPIARNVAPPRIKTILSIGRLVEMKGMMMLLKSFTELHEAFPEARLVIIGDGPARTQLQSWVSSHQLGSIVELPGIKDEAEIVEYHKRAWVYVQPSIGSESFSLSTLEACASGLPVIASDQVHVATQFARVGAAELYSSGNSVELTSALRKILSANVEEINIRGTKARKYFEENYSSKIILPQIENLCFG